MHDCCGEEEKEENDVTPVEELIVTIPQRAER